MHAPMLMLIVKVKFGGKNTLKKSCQLRQMLKKIVAEEEDNSDGDSKPRPPRKTMKMDNDREAI